MLSLGSATGMSANRRVAGGVSLLERQVDVALALGCRRVWLFTPEQDGLALRAQRLAEAGGARFRLIQRGRQLLGSLRQQDELLVLAEGLLLGDRLALDPLAGGPVILTLPVEAGMAAGFERLDRQACWGGGMVLPGRVVERLDELGEDIEPVSALLRAGRAARVAEQPIAEEWLAQGRWSLTADRVPLGDDSEPGPGRSLLQQWLVGPIGRWLATRPKFALAWAGAGGLAGAGAVGALLWASPAAALLLAVLSVVLLDCWIGARKAADARVFSGRTSGKLGSWLPLVAEPVAAVALVSGLHTQFGWASTVYIAVLTTATWVLAGMGRHLAAALFADRAWLWLGCGIGGLAGWWIGGPALASALSLGAILLNMRNQPAITQA